MTLLIPPSREIAHLYRITHHPSGLVYWGSTWGEGKSIIRRFDAHITGCPRTGGKWFKHLLENGATREDFGIDLMMIGPVKFVCEIESQLAKNSLWPNGLNGNAGLNIIRSPEGQRKVEEAVSKAKKGRTKETSPDVASQAKKAAEQCGDKRTEKQKEWDKKKGETNKANGNRPPEIPKGSKRMNNGVEAKWVPPDQIEMKKTEGWIIGWLGERPLSNKGRKTMRRDGEMIHVLLEEVEDKLSEGWLLGNGPQKNPRRKK